MFKRNFTALFASVILLLTACFAPSGSTYFLAPPGITDSIADQFIIQDPALQEFQRLQNDVLDALHDFNNVLTVIGGQPDIIKMRGGLKNDDQRIIEEIINANLDLSQKLTKIVNGNYTEVKKLKENLKQAIDTFTACTDEQRINIICTLIRESNTSRPEPHSDEKINRTISNYRLKVHIAHFVLNSLSDTDPAAVDVEKLIDIVSQELENLGKGNNVKVEFINLEPIPPIYAREGQIFRMVYNLVKNSIENAKKSGATGKVFVVSHAHNSTAVIEVINNGPVMSEEAITQFNNNRTVQSSKRSSKKGQGLDIIRQFALQNKGITRAYADPAYGTTFMTILPLAGADISDDILMHKELIDADIAGQLAAIATMMNLDDLAATVRATEPAGNALRAQAVGPRALALSL